MMLEQTQDSKEIKPVNPKGNQSRIFIGKTDAGAEEIRIPDFRLYYKGTVTKAVCTGTKEEI